MSDYKPSGRFSTKSFINFILTAVIAYPLFAIIYAYAIYYIPLAYLNVFSIVIYAILIGLATMFFVIQKGKVRNTTVAMLFGLLGGLISYYIHWAIWCDLVINGGIKFSEVFHLLTNPQDLWAVVVKINEQGTWSLGRSSSTPVSGIFLTILWVIEFAIVIFGAVYVAFNQSKEPFCEETDRWFDQDELAPLSYIEDANVLKQNLKSDNISSLQKVEKPKEESHSVFTIYSSRSQFYVSVQNKLAHANKKGEVEFDETILFEHLKISRQTANQLKEIGVVAEEE